MRRDGDLAGDGGGGGGRRSERLGGRASEMGLMLSSLLACSGGAALLACVYPNWAADRAALTQAVHFVAFGLVALGAGILAGQMSCFLQLITCILITANRQLANNLTLN